MQFEKKSPDLAANCILICIFVFYCFTMIKKGLIIITILVSWCLNLSSQKAPDAEVFLITCAPGTETYSIYGHSALRIIISEEESDLAYNWGVFDFATPNFAWKFAKGRLEYMLGVYPFNRFLEDYFYEERSVYQQKINLEPEEINTLFALLKENLKPENIKYRYDFFYDDCSTRIRDLLEKAIGGKLRYPPEVIKDIPTFREKVGNYQRPYPWLQLGVDLLMGTPGDKKASYRDRMFLPIDLQEGLSKAVINRNGKMIPLLQNPVTILQFDPPKIRHVFYSTPLFIFSILLIGIILFSSAVRGFTPNTIVDLVVFSIYSLLALMMIFFNFFTDHQQMKWNLNIIWLNPFILMCLISIIFKKEWHIWFRIVFFLALIAFIVQIVFPNAFNNAFIPLELLLIIRCSIRARFSWNPLSMDLTEL